MHIRAPITLAVTTYLSAQGCATAEDLAEPGPQIMTPSTDGVTDGPPPEFDPLPLRVGVAKAKDLLTGLPLTESELKTSENLEGLKNLIDGWTATPLFEETMLRFFADAFEQSPLDLGDMLQFALGLERPDNFQYWQQPQMIRALHEMFARTAIGIVQEGRPFTEIATTTRFKLNTPLMATLAFLDAHPRADNGAFAGDSRLLKRFPGFRYLATRNRDGTGQPVPIPETETFNPEHPNFMRWFQSCDIPAGEYGPYTGPLGVELAFHSLFGAWGVGGCGGSSEESKFSPTEWATWRWVTVRKALPAETLTYFWDLPKLRSLSEIVVQTPRVGFFTTPAFFARWPTNDTNSFRGTTNQALIVGLGRSLNSEAIFPSTSESINDSAHISPGSICVGCHQTMDPMREFFRHDYSTTSSPRAQGSAVAGSPIAAEAIFNFGGNAVRGRGVTAFGAAIAGHQDFAKAWTQKLCMWANAAACVDDDPEFQRVTEVFRASNHNFKVLLRELLSSPLSTFTSRTKSSDRNTVATTIARRDVFCQRLAARTKRGDVCNQNFVKEFYRVDTLERAYSNGLPQINYVRGEALPIVPRAPGILFQPAVERLCRRFAEKLVGLDNTRTEPAPWPLDWTKPMAPQVAPALDDFVSVVMGIPKSDDVYTELRAALQLHYDEVFALSKDPNDTVRADEGLKSAFVSACSSPYATTMGL